MEEDGECVCVVCVLMCMEKKKPKKKNSGRTRVFSNRAVDANHQHHQKPTEKKGSIQGEKKKPEAIETRLVTSETFKKEED